MLINTIKGIENSAIAREWTPGLSRPYTDPFKIIHSKEKRSFPGAGFHFFQSRLEDRMDITLHYSDEDEKKHKQTYSYYLKDFDSTTRFRTPQETLIEQGVKNLEKLEKTLSNLSQDIHAIRKSAFLPSGFNLSKTTLSFLAGEENVKWPGNALSIEAIAEILEVDFNTAIKIQSEIFGATHNVGGENTPLEEIELPEGVKEKISSRLIIPCKS